MIDQILFHRYTMPVLWTVLAIDALVVVLGIAGVFGKVC